MNKFKVAFMLFIVAIASVFIAQPASAAPTKGCGSVYSNTDMVWNNSSFYKWEKGNYCQGSYNNTDQYFLKYQADGNFVLYNLWTNRAVWASNTANRGAGQLVFQTDGNVVIYDTSGRPLWAMRVAPRAGTYDFYVGTSSLVQRLNRSTVYGTAGW
jgi:hypothetical protein